MLSRSCGALSFWASACLLLTPPAHADRPLQTEAAGVLVRGVCEAEAVDIRNRNSDADHAGKALQLGCGIGLGTQWGLSTTRKRTAEGPVVSLGLGGKSGIWQGAGDNAAALTLAYGIEWDKSPGESRRLSATSVRAVLSVPVASGTWHSNLVLGRDEVARQRSHGWALAYESKGFDIGPFNLAPMAEAFGTRGERAWWNLALRASVLPETLFVDGSYGRQGGSRQASLATLAVKLVY
jgi:hypothetical protein